MQPQPLAIRVGRTVRGPTSLLLFGLIAASGCVDEVGGDGYEPPPAMSKGGAASGIGAGGAEGGGAGDDAVIKGGSGGKGGGGKGGRGGSAGKGGTSTTGEAGAGGEPTPGSVCGNGVVEQGEDCDDGNNRGFDSCPADCNAACQTCEQTYCKNVRSLEAGAHNWTSPDVQRPLDPLTACTEIEGEAKAGPAQGEPRADLCQAMVDCIRRERCWQIVPDDAYRADGTAATGAEAWAFMRCYCDRDVTEGKYLNNCQVPAPTSSSGEPEPADAPPHFIEGKCAREIWEASERNDQGQVLLNPLNKAAPLGVANYVFQACDKRLCTEECIPSASKGVVAQISADILAAENEAGESPLGDLIAESQRQATGTDFAFVNEATFTTLWGPAGLIFAAAPGRPADADGRVLESEVRHVLFGMDALPGNLNTDSGYRLMTMQLSGQQVYDVLNAEQEFIHVAGLSFTWDSSLASGSRVTEVRKGGAVIDKATRYSVTANNAFVDALTPALQAHDPAFSAVATDKQPEAALVSYLQGLTQPVAPPALDRVIRLN